MIPKWLVYTSLCLIALAFIPPALIARQRTTPSERRRIHIIQDMDNQYKFRAQHGNELFADTRAMRPPVEGTVARGELFEDDHLYKGVADQAWAETFPPQVELNAEFFARGQEQFNIYCRPCHGEAGYGDGIVNERAMELMATAVNGTTWVQAKSVHDATVRDQPVGQLYNSITNGVRNMAAYSAQIDVRDRWAIVAYVKALQRSQHALPGDVSADMRGSLPTTKLQTESTNP